MNVQASSAAAPIQARSRVPTWAWLVLGVLLGAAMMFVGLARAGRLADPPRADVLVSLAQTLEVEHRRVDVLLERGQVADAIAALEALRALEWPTREVAGDEAVILRHDAYGRLLRLRLDHPEVDARPGDALLSTLDEGLGARETYRAVRTNPFTARLLALRGELLEQGGRDDDALAAYEAALEMNRALLQQARRGAVPSVGDAQEGAR